MSYSGKRGSTVRKSTTRRKPRSSKRRQASPSDAKLAAIISGALIVISLIVATVWLTLKNPAEDGRASIVETEAAEPAYQTAVPTAVQSPELRSTQAPLALITPTDKPELRSVASATPSPTQAAPVRTTPSHSVRPSSAPTQAPAAAVNLAPRKGSLLVVIDDAGNNLAELGPFLSFSGPLVIAVLPGLPHSAEAARMARAAGKEVFLHQPMEAVGGQNPGPGAIYKGMSAAEIRAVLEKNLRELGPVIGMNNHQGSLITSDSFSMKVILEFCQEHDLVFLDSRTIATTVAPEIAAAMDMRIMERDIFLDNSRERAAIIGALNEGLRKADKKGATVMIGHAFTQELADVLHSLYPELIDQGYSLTTISRIVMGSYDDDDFGD